VVVAVLPVHLDPPDPLDHRDLLESEVPLGMQVELVAKVTGVPQDQMDRQDSQENLGIEVMSVHLEKVGHQDRLDSLAIKVLVDQWDNQDEQELLDNQV